MYGARGRARHSTARHINHTHFMTFLSSRPQPQQPHSRDELAASLDFPSQQTPPSPYAEHAFLTIDNLKI